ncbi:MAG: RcnB family protein [Novosphingobium sp.]|jgi:Ni/Co efflux regulator RcnB|nr:RcnB family protein [Novosphingobium sp.]
MNKTFSAAVAGLTAIASVLAATPTMAKPWHDRDRDERHGNWDRDRDGRHGRWDRRDYRWKHYGGSYGYHGYSGRWRTGQHFPHFNNNRYVIRDWRAYNLPPPRHGYRYYRDDRGDIIMAAIGSGIIGLIIGSQLR